MSAKIWQTVRCRFCPWGATHKADTVLESHDFLTRLYFFHCADMHNCHPDGGERRPPA